MSFRLALVLAVALALSGCHRRKATTLERDQAANMVSEAEFATTMKEWGRAEGLYSKALALCPENGDNWMDLGVVRIRLNDHQGARSAYKSALEAYDDAIDLNPGDSQLVVRKAFALVILGRADEARSAVEKALKRLPDDRRLRRFVDDHQLDAMIADPALKGVSP
jgi:Flp pilus assembly protein TadD